MQAPTITQKPYRKRYEQILSVFARHGFDLTLSKLKRVSPSIGPFDSGKPDTHGKLSPAVHLRLALEELGPTFIKFGQLLSTREDLLGPEYIQELTKLQDSAPPESWETVRAVIAEELGDEPDQIFAQIDPVPLAAASLGQVHTAVLKNGDAVVIKVQRPNVRKILETDLAILRDLAVLAKRTEWGECNQPEEIVEEFDLSLHREIDYTREGRNADRFRDNFDGVDTIYVPTIYWDYSTQRVLVMERLTGIKIDDTAALDAAGFSRKRVAKDATNNIVKEVLIDGFYHADPHPGNLVVMPDGAIGVMDFGMVGELHEHDRQCLTRLFICAASQDAEGIVSELMRLSAAGSGVNRARLVGDIKRLFQKYVGLTLKELKFQEMWADFTTITSRHRIRIPPDMQLLARTAVLMEGLGTKLDPDYDFYAIAVPIVQDLKQQMLMPREDWKEVIFRQAIDWGEFIDLFPRVSRRLLEKLDQNDPFDVELRDWGKMLSGIGRLINRLAVSMIVAAMIIGLAILIPTTTSGTLVHTLIALGFLVVIIMGIWLLFTFLRGK